jgi:hypothetical protein
MAKNLTSPNELLDEAKKQMLGGRDPKSYNDWALVMNFFALNVDQENDLLACKMLRSLYKIPLNDDQVRAIVEFQRARKAGMKHA